MPSGVRARARATRERQAAEAAAARGAVDARAARRRERRVRLTAWSRMLGGALPSRSRQSGLLARRRRAQVRILVAGLVLLNVLFWFLEPVGAMRALVLLVSVLAAPVLYTVLFRKA